MHVRRGNGRRRSAETVFAEHVQRRPVKAMKGLEKESTSNRLKEGGREAGGARERAAHAKGHY